MKMGRIGMVLVTGTALGSSVVMTRLGVYTRSRPSRSSLCASQLPPSRSWPSWCSSSAGFPGTGARSWTLAWWA